MKYQVGIREVHVTEVVVEAANEAEAKQKASDLVASGEYGDFVSEYSHTLGPETWSVDEEI